VVLLLEYPNADPRLIVAHACFHRFKPADHRFDPCANLFVLLQQASALGGSTCPAAAGAHRFSSLICADGHDEGLRAAFQALQFEFDS